MAAGLADAARARVVGLRKDIRPQQGLEQSNALLPCAERKGKYSATNFSDHVS